MRSPGPASDRMARGLPPNSRPPPVTSVIGSLQGWLVKMRSARISVGPAYGCWGPYEKKRGCRATPRRRGHGEDGADWGDAAATRGCQGLPREPSGRGQAEGPAPRALRGGSALPAPGSWTSDLQNREKTHFCCLKRPVLRCFVLGSPGN